MLEAQVCKIILKICCKSSLVYLKIKNPIAKTIIIRKFALNDLIDWSDNLSSNLRGGDNLKRAIKRSFLQKQLHS